MDIRFIKIIKKMIAENSNGLIKKSYIKSLRPWLGYYTFEYKGKSYKFAVEDCKIIELE